MSATPGGWFADPTGRFSRRWYDGQRWTEHVVAANGSTISDPMPAAAPATVAPPPPAAVGTPPPPFAAAPPAPLVAPGPLRPPAAGVRLMPGATLLIGVLGLIVVAVSIFGLPWASGGGQSVTFLDLSKAARNADGSGELVPRTYAAYGAFVLFGLTLLGVVLAGSPLPGRVRAARAWRIVVSAVAGVAAVAHTVTVVRLFRGPASPELWAWLGTGGYLVVILALVIGHYGRRPR